MSSLIPLVLSGIMRGMIYGLVALGFVVVYKSCKIFNFAMGAFTCLGAYIGFTMIVVVGLPEWLGIIITVILVGLLGYSLERFPFRPMIGQSELALLMVTLGIYVFFLALVSGIWIDKYPVASFPFELGGQAISFLGQDYPLLMVIGFAASAGLAGIFALFFYFTRAGLHMRATAEGTQQAQSMGIRVTQVIAQSWAFALIVAAIAGIIMGYLQGLGLVLANIGIIAIAAALVGGLDSIPGALVGGIIVGLSESLAGGYIGYASSQVAPYIILIIIILVKPYGLFGLERIERV